MATAPLISADTMRYLIIIALVLTCAVLNGQEFPTSGEYRLEWGGHMRSSLFAGDLAGNRPAVLQAGYAQLKLELDAKAGNRADGKIDLRLNGGFNRLEKMHPLEIREAYVDLYTGPFSLRVGKMITPWGKGSIYNPTDLVTPMDPVARTPDDSDLKLGSWGMKGAVNLGHSARISILWKPRYRSSSFLLSPDGLPDGVVFGDPDFPGMELKEGSAGVSLDLRTRPADGTLYFYCGYDPWPGIEPQSVSFGGTSMLPVEIRLREFAYRTRMLGFDLAVPAGPWIARAEASWKHPEGSQVENPNLPFPELAYTLEMESSWSSLTLIAGYYGKTILSYKDPAGKPSLRLDLDPTDVFLAAGEMPAVSSVEELLADRVTAFNRLYNYQLNEFYHTLFVVLEGDYFFSRVKPRLLVTFSPTASEWYFRPGVAYCPSDGTSFTIGYFGMTGPEDSIFGLAGPVLNALYLSYKLTF